MRFLILAFFSGVSFYFETYVIFADCSVGGFRDSKWIDDSRVGDCLPLNVRSVLLVLIPIIWLIGSIIILKKFKHR